MTDAEDQLHCVIQSAARLIVDAVLSLLQEDPHQWSQRPCSTCKTISGLVDRDFGCYLYAKQRAVKP